MGEVNEPESYNLKFTAQQDCLYTMQNYIYLYAQTAQVCNRNVLCYIYCTRCHNDRMCHVHDGLIRLHTLAKQNTEIYNTCKLQCSASFLFWCRASNSSINDSKSIVCARFDSIDKRGGVVDGTDSTRAARSDCSTNVRWLSLKRGRTGYRRHSASRLAASASFTTIYNDAAWNFKHATSLVEVGCTPHI